jgi:hypothetical protein
MKRKFKQRWSTIQLISTKQAITSHINSQNINKDQVLPWDAHDNVPGLKPVNGIKSSLFDDVKFSWYIQICL